MTRPTGQSSIVLQRSSAKLKLGARRKRILRRPCGKRRNFNYKSTLSCWQKKPRNGSSAGMRNRRPLRSGHGGGRSSERRRRSGLDG